MLARIAIRIAAVEALKGRTLIGDNVLDSQIGALDVAADDSIRTDQERPFISVYTDASRGDGDGRSLHKAGATELTIEAGITAAMVVTDAETGASEVIPGLPATDPAFEFYLDCVGRQIATALTDPANEWAEIWRGLSSGIVSVDRKRTSDAASGTRIAAHQVVVTVDLLPDPVFGEPVAPTSIWAKLFAKMASTSHPYLATMQALVGTPADGTDHDASRRRFGLTLDEARALTLADGAEPPIQSVAFETMVP